MSRLVASLAFSLAFSLFTTVSHADVYKYTDANGQVKYTDKPEMLPAELLAKIKSQRTDNSALADRVAADLKARDAATKAQEAASKNSADTRKATESTAADKAERCTKARERYESVMSAQRLYSTDAAGERTYMDDKQTDQARASAKQLMDTWCN